MVCQKTFKNKLLIFLLVCFLCLPLSVQAAETYGYIGQFRGDIIFEQTNNIIPLSASYVHDYDVDLDISELEMNGTVVSNSTAFMTYTGNMDTRIIVVGDVGSYLNGSVVTYFTFTVDDENEGQIDVSIDNDDIEGVTITTQRVNVDTNLTRLHVIITFNNYEITRNVTYIPLHIDVQYTYRYDASEYGSIQAKWMYLGIDQWEDYTTQYDDVRDLPGYYGDTSRQNQTIIDRLSNLISVLSGKFDALSSRIDSLIFGTSGSSGSSTSLSEGQSTGTSGTLQEQANNLQEEANTLQEEANETQKNIFDKIADFFDNFFARLGEFLLGLIVPSAEELTAFLDEVNDWFGERLGFIWYPFSFAVDMVAALANGTADTGFQVPEFKLNILGTEYQIWGGMTVDMDAFGIFQYVRIFTSFLLVAGIVKLALDKWDEWIGGHGVG